MEQNCLLSELIVINNLSVRATNVLLQNVGSIEELLSLDEEKILNLRNCGRKTVKEILAFQNKIRTDRFIPATFSEEQPSPSIADRLKEAPSEESLSLLPLFSLLPVLNKNGLEITPDDLHPDFHASTKVSDLALSVQTSEVLKNLGIETIGEVMLTSYYSLLNTKNLSINTLAELKKTIRSICLTGNCKIKGKVKYITGIEGGLSGYDQINLALITIEKLGGKAVIDELYPSIEEKLKGNKLSIQGKADFRLFLNNVAVAEGLLYNHHELKQVWGITPKGREYIRASFPNAIGNLTTQKEENVSTAIEELIDASHRPLRREDIIDQLKSRFTEVNIASALEKETIFINIGEGFYDRPEKWKQRSSRDLIKQLPASLAEFTRYLISRNNCSYKLVLGLVFITGMDENRSFDLPTLKERVLNYYLNRKEKALVVEVDNATTIMSDIDESLKIILNSIFFVQNNTSIVLKSIPTSLLSDLTTMDLFVVTLLKAIDEYLEQLTPAVSLPATVEAASSPIFTAATISTANLKQEKPHKVISHIVTESLETGEYRSASNAIEQLIDSSDRPLRRAEIVDLLDGQFSENNISTALGKETRFIAIGEGFYDLPAKWQQRNINDFIRLLPEPVAEFARYLVSKNNCSYKLVLALVFIRGMDNNGSFYLPTLKERFFSYYLSRKKKGLVVEADNVTISKINSIEDVFIRSATNKPIESFLNSDFFVKDNLTILLQPNRVALLSNTTTQNLLIIILLKAIDDYFLQLSPSLSLSAISDNSAVSDNPSPFLNHEATSVNNTCHSKKEPKDFSQIYSYNDDEEQDDEENSFSISIKTRDKAKIKI